MNMVEKLNATIAKPSTKPGVRALCLTSAHSDELPTVSLMSMAGKASRAGDWETCVLNSLAAHTVTAMAILFQQGRGGATEDIFNLAYEEAVAVYVASIEESVAKHGEPKVGAAVPKPNVKRQDGVN